MRILAISGSLRASSSNTALLVAAAALAPPDWTVELYDGLASLPHFNPDLDADPLPAAVLALREKVGSCRGLVLSSPEYARGIPGAFKNALDWLVGSPDFAGKPVALLGASPRSTSADAQLCLVLATMSARLVDAASITLPLLGRHLDAAAITADAALAAPLRAALDGFGRALAAAE